MLRSVLFWVAAAAVTASWGSHSDFTVVALSMETTTAAQQQPSSIENGVPTLPRAAVPTSAFTTTTTTTTTSRRRAIGWIASTVTTTATVVSFESDGGGSTLCRAAEPVDRFNVEDYLKTGMVMNPMGVSGQAGT
jgi:hypothetical protein